MTSEDDVEDPYRPESPHKGEGKGGESINPLALPEEPSDKPKREAPLGLPVTPEEYERLKKAARRGPAPASEAGQEDSAATPRKTKKDRSGGD